MKEYKISVNGNDYKVAIHDVEDSVAKVSVNGVNYEAKIDGLAHRPKTPKIVRKPVFTPSDPHHTEPAPVADTPRPAAAAAGGGAAIKSPLPGTILDVVVREGDSVAVGQKLMVLEAMKMENNIEADKAGVVKSIAVRKGDSVLEGDLLITIG
ncbi:MAG: biotin/lipoyl-containing protein [Rikenellaceae bacterium]